MEVCGGQTNTIAGYGLDQCLSPNVTFIHGPGCPVCVTSTAFLNVAQQLASESDTILCTFGDMMRVPGSGETLLETKSRGGNIEVVYSPLEALRLAGRHPERQVVFFAIGFETTAPLTALSIIQAQESRLKNFSVLCAHVLIPPAIATLLQAAQPGIDALLAPGHVGTVTGTAPYHQIQTDYHLPIIVTGFEPTDILLGVYQAVRLLKRQESDVVVQYSRAVTPQGNLAAQNLIQEVFAVTDREWRGLGVISASGLEIRSEYRDLDALRRFLITLTSDELPCNHCTYVLQGRLAPLDCPNIGQACTTEHPLGAPMVSTEGACASYLRFAGRTRPAASGSGYPGNMTE